MTVIAVCIKLNRHVQMKVAEMGMKNLDEEFLAMSEAGSKEEVKHDKISFFFFSFFPSALFREVCFRVVIYNHQAASTHRKMPWIQQRPVHALHICLQAAVHAVRTLTVNTCVL